MLKISALALAGVFAIALSGAAFAQKSGGLEVGAAGGQAGVGNVTQVQGNTKIDANAQNVNTTAFGINNSAETAVGSVGGAGVTQIQGNTTIDANAKNVNTTAFGINNTAETKVGTVGGK